jgi:AraC-like DNA-binding protein
VKKTRDDREIELSVWRSVPKSLPPSLRAHALPLERIDPLIRIAHRRGGAPHLTFPERVIVDHEILLILSGKGDLLMPGGAIPFAAHDVLFVRPFVKHTFAGRGDVDHIAVHFDFSSRSAEPDLDRRRPYAVEFADGVTLPAKQRAIPHGPVERSLSLVVEHFGRGTAVGRMRARGEFLCALNALLVTQDQQRGEPGRRRAQLDRAVVLMRERLAERVSGADLERASGLGSSQLHALFRELTGYSPMEYLRRLRIELARELLADPSLSIKEVAARAGFSEPNHFSRVFSRIDGVPPTAFREALLVGKASRRS